MLFDFTQHYSYEFNGMEADDKIKGNGNSYTTHFRQFDPRICRWLTIDPKADIYPFESPYAAFHNNPVYWTDPRGDDPPTKLLQKTARTLAHFGLFGSPKKYKSGGLQVGYDEETNSYAYAYSGKLKPSEAVKEVFELATSGQIDIDCGLYCTLVHSYAVMKNMGKKKFNKLFEQENGTYNMFITIAGLRQGRTDIGFDSEMQKFGSNDQQKAEETARNAEIGSIITLESLSPENTVESHRVENMIKVGEDQYAAFNYTSGENPQFFTFDEVKELIGLGGSTKAGEKIEYRVSTVTTPKYD